MAVAVAVTAVAAAAAAEATVATAVAVAVAVETAGDRRLGAGSASRLPLESLKLLIALKSPAHQTLTHIEWLRSRQFRLCIRQLAA